MEPCIIVDTETTGIPDRPRGWEPRIIEIGAVVVTADGRVLTGPDEAFCRLVRQDEGHLYDPRAEGAWGLSDLTPEKVLAGGDPEGVVAVMFAAWLGWARAAHEARVVRAFNQGFDFRFLMAVPWFLFRLRRAGECVMLAAQEIMDAHGALPRWDSGEAKWPRASEAEEFFRARGHDIVSPGPAHRALRDAIVEAQIAVAIEREREG